MMKAATDCLVLRSQFGIALCDFPICFAMYVAVGQISHKMLVFENEMCRLCLA